MYLPTLGLQIPSKKVLEFLKTPQSTFLEGIWSPRVIFCCSNLFSVFSVASLAALGVLLETTRDFGGRGS